MKKTFKNIAATVMAMATLVGSTIGMSTTSISAFAASEGTSSVDSIMAMNYSYTWNNIKVVTTLDKGFSLNTSTSITVYVDDCPGGAAIVKLYKFGDINPVRSFSLPSAPMPSQAVSVSLTAGSYYWTVQPNGCESTSGSLYVTGVDGVTDVP